MAVYLLHFARPISEHHTTQHYIGYAEDVPARLAAHRSGHGARLCEVALERGIDFVIARVWMDGDRKLERRLKNRHEAPRLCPICGRAHAQLDLFLDFDLDQLEELAF